MTSGALVLQGDLGRDTSLDDVLAAVGTSRQWLEVVLHDERRARGSILIKSGQVVTAFAAPDRRGVEAFRSLRGGPGTTFSVYRRSAPAELVEPIGPLDELLTRVAEARWDPTEDVVLEGSFADFAVREVLDVLSLSRQTLELVATRADGSTVTLVTKAGRVLSCDDPALGRTGVEALHGLLRGPGQRFRVTRRDVRTFGEPLGTLAELLAPSRLEPARQEHLVVLEGTFAEIPLAEVLEVVSLTRQLVELVLRDASGVRGALLVKAGRVLEARSRSGANGRAAALELLRDPGRSFSVERRTGPVGDREPLALLSDLARPRPMERVEPVVTGPVRELVLEGRFANHPMAEVLQTLSLSRQHLVMLLRSGGRTRGRLTVKAGRVLEAEHGGRRGAAVLDALLADPGESWVVYRMPPGAPIPDPIDTLDALVARLAPPSPPHARDDDAQPTVVMVAPPQGWAPRPRDLRVPDEALEAPQVAPTPAPPARRDVEPIRPTPAFEERLAELTAAIASLERALSRQGAPDPRAERAEQAFAAVALLQITTLIVAAAALLYRVLAG